MGTSSKARDLMERNSRKGTPAMPTRFNELGVRLLTGRTGMGVDLVDAHNNWFN
jgi:hypothetical protein